MAEVRRNLALVQLNAFSYFAFGITYTIHKLPEHQTDKLQGMAWHDQYMHISLEDNYTGKHVAEQALVDRRSVLTARSGVSMWHNAPLSSNA
jgi:hypothetical protein